MFLNCLILRIKKLKERKKWRDCFVHGSARIEDGVEIGRFTEIGANSVLTKYVSRVGRFCSISYNVTLGLGMHPLYMVSSNSFFFNNKWGVVNKSKFTGYDLKGKTIVENDVWIGAGALVCPGVKISNGAVVGAGAVVTKDVPPYAIVAGNPAKVIKYRFSEDIIRDLLRIEWWNWRVEKLTDNIELFCDIEEFIEKHRVENE